MSKACPNCGHVDKKVSLSKAAAVVFANNRDFRYPEGLSPLGHTAFTTIMNVLAKHRLTYAGGSTVFHPPTSASAVLTVSYDGGDVGEAFRMEDSYAPAYKALVSELKKIGLYSEEQTVVRSNIYPIG